MLQNSLDGIEMFAQIARTFQIFENSREVETALVVGRRREHVRVPSTWPVGIYGAEKVT